jgi:hypothetical protein
MAFVPPLWSKFGNAAKDLLTKKFDYKNQLTTKNNVAPDLTIETTIAQGEKDSFTGNVKANYKNKDFGSVEAEVGTVPNKDKATLQAEVKATKFYDGLTLAIKGSDVPLFRAGAEYRQESVATSVNAELGKEGYKTEATLAAGFDGFSVGGQVDYCFTHGLRDFNFGAEYTQNDYVLTLKTAEKTERLLASYWHNIPTSRNKLKTQVGAQANWNLDDGKKVFTVGTEHDIDDATTLKGKIDTDGVLASVLEHRLKDPHMRLNLSANWQISARSTTPKQFGVALTFGDYA